MSARQEQLYRSLGKTSAVIIGLPARFDLIKALRTATSIRIATAYAHNSGWELLRPAIENTNAKCVRLLTGLDFCQTEPSVLRKWHDLATRPGFEARLYAPGRTEEARTFHPKVLIVNGPTENRSFAWVGSGNLSRGGFLGNVECGVHVPGGKDLRSLREWFDSLFEDEQISVRLTEHDIRLYEPRYKKAHPKTALVRAQERNAGASIRTSHKAYLSRWNQAVSAARRYLRHMPRSWIAYRNRAAADILEILHYPGFEFTRDDWRGFYGIWAMGHLRAINRDRTYANGPRLRRGLRLLMNEAIPIGERLDSILTPGHRNYVRCLGANAATKILASRWPTKYPVLNGPVKLALAHFGYEPPHGASLGEKYEAFAQLMRTFRKEVGRWDMVALDSFFEAKGKQLKMDAK